MTSLFVGVIAAAGSLLAAVVGLWRIVRWNERVRLTDGRQQRAEAIGLHYAGRTTGEGHRYSGVRGERRVAAWSKGGVWILSTRLARPVAGPLHLSGPQELGLHGARIQPAAPPEWSFEDAVVTDARLSKRFTITEDTVEIRLRGLTNDLDVATPVRLLIELVESIEDAFDEGWLELGRSWSLVPGLRQGTGRPPLSGMVEGRRVEARYRIDGSLEVRAGWSNPRLAELVVARREDLPEALDLDNPVVGMLLGVWHPDPACARRLFADDELSEAMLAVVHAHPGSVVQRGAVLLRAHQVPDAELAAVVGATIRLAGLLSRA
ncbi:MAG: hypothetical protein GY913_06040 [Proteobacteria bacterium]|nr:hypothetical protein [Pseudomonadota bacterium]MCP4916466.1 hypothetical protein [Pseudomonadota bacterium]